MARTDLTGDVQIVEARTAEEMVATRDVFIARIVCLLSVSMTNMPKIKGKE